LLLPGSTSYPNEAHDWSIILCPGAFLSYNLVRDMARISCMPAVRDMRYCALMIIGVKGTGLWGVGAGILLKGVLKWKINGLPKGWDAIKTASVR